MFYNTYFFNILNPPLYSRFTVPGGTPGYDLLGQPVPYNYPGIWVSQSSIGFGTLGPASGPVPWGTSGYGFGGGTFGHSGVSGSWAPSGVSGSWAPPGSFSPYPSPQPPLTPSSSCQATGTCRF